MRFLLFSDYLLLILFSKDFSYEQCGTSYIISIFSHGNSNFILGVFNGEIFYIGGFKHFSCFLHFIAVSM